MRGQVSGFTRAVPLLVVLAFVAVSAGGFLYFYQNAGGATPWSDDEYVVTFRTNNTKNLVTSGDVRIAGVAVGHIRETRRDEDGALVEVALDPDAAPLHEGVTVRIGMKSILGQSFLDVVDGDGQELESGTVLADDAVVPAVDVDELLGMFDPPTQKALRRALQGLAGATAGRQQDIEVIMAALGPIGREGRIAVNALVEQSDSLEALIGEVDRVMVALDAGEGAIADVVSNAHRITAATAPQAPALRESIRTLPSLLDNATLATGSLSDLSVDLVPVARDLRASAPYLKDALGELPATTRDLRGLLPDLDQTLRRSPATLELVPGVAGQVRELLPEVRAILLDVVPMVEYIEPYGTDIGSFLGNFGATFDRPMENGVRPVSLAPIFNEYSVRNSPLRFAQLNPLHWSNPYPAPNTADKPSKWTGSYPRVERLDP